METLNDKIVKTRKPHQCHGCGELFFRNSKLRALTQVDGGQINTTYWCKPCVLFYKECEYDDDGIMPFEFKGDPDYLKFKVNLPVENQKYN